MAETSDFVAQVNIYPLKSCHAATIDGNVPVSLDVGPTGFEAYGVRDREYIIYDPSEQVMVTQRGWNAKGTKAVFPEDRKLATATVDIASDHLKVRAPGFGELQIDTATVGAGQGTIEVFGNELPVVPVHRDASRFFSGLLMRDVEVYRADRERPRLLPGQYSRPGAANQVAAADGFPFLWTSQLSLDHQHEQNGLPLGMVPIKSYRANIVTHGTGMEPFEEDRAGVMRFGAMSAFVVKACARCPIPNIDQDTADRDGGGLKVLRGRAGSNAEGVKGVFFGQNLNHVYIPGQTVSLADKVMIASYAGSANVMLRPSVG